MEQKFYLCPGRELLLETPGMYTGRPFVCRKCLQNYAIEGYCNYHYSNCKVKLGNGIHIVNKASEKVLHYVIDNIGHLSALTQGIDLAVTSTGKLKSEKIDARTFLLVNDEKPIGILTTSNRKIGAQDIIQLDDFYILQPYQRKGFGGKLYKFALNYHRAAPLDLIYDRPSAVLLRFLKRQGTDIKKVRVI